MLRWILEDPAWLENVTGLEVLAVVDPELAESLAKMHALCEQRVQILADESKVRGALGCLQAVPFQLAR